MVDLSELLRDAREKSAAEAAVTEVRVSLTQLEAEIRRLKSVRAELQRRIAKSGGLMARLRRDDEATHALEAKVAQVVAGIEVKSGQQVEGQKYLRSLMDDAYGVELARAKVGAELKQRTALLGPHDPVRERLAEMDVLRENLTRARALAKSVSNLAGELLTTADTAERLDDGTDVLYVSLLGATQKYEQLQDTLQPNALIMRMILKDRLEIFRTLDGAEESYASLAVIALLLVEEDSVDPNFWLHRVREALRQAMDVASQDEKAIRAKLVDIDNERVKLLA